jgi:hypothetical protein
MKELDDNRAVAFSRRARRWAWQPPSRSYRQYGQAWHIYSFLVKKLPQ